jgi:DNA-directed RNA polymerase specialized sigma24 family protein
VSFDDDEDGFSLAEITPDDRPEGEVAAFELWETLKTRLTDEELFIVSSVASGTTQGELAASMVVTQQAVAKRLRRMRRIVKELME